MSTRASRGAIIGACQTGAVDHASDLDALARHYDAALAAHGPSSPEAVQWADRSTQERRMAILTEVVGADELRTASILDFGCGTGHLLTWLEREHGYTGRYTGYDIAPQMVEAARAQHPAHPTATFECRDILHEGIDGAFDLVVVSGTFNNRLPDNWRFLTDLLAVLYPAATRALAFNCLSTYVEYATDDLAHQQPEAVFAHCKAQLSPLVTLRHDYLVRDGVMPYEFTTYVYRGPFDPVPSLPVPAP